MLFASGSTSVRHVHVYDARLIFGMMFDRCFYAVVDTATVLSFHLDGDAVTAAAGAAAVTAAC